MPGPGGWQDQPSVGHQSVVVKGDVEAVGEMHGRNLLGALDLGTGLCFGNHYPSLYWLEKQDRPMKKSGSSPYLFGGKACFS